MNYPNNGEAINPALVPLKAARDNFRTWLVQRKATWRANTAMVPLPAHLMTSDRTATTAMTPRGWLADTEEESEEESEEEEEEEEVPLPGVGEVTAQQSGVAVGKSGYRGVHEQPGGKWQARIGDGEKREDVGTFTTTVAAAVAYNKRAKELKRPLNSISPELLADDDGQRVYRKQSGGAGQQAGLKRPRGGAREATATAKRAGDDQDSHRSTGGAATRADTGPGTSDRNAMTATPRGILAMTATPRGELASPLFAAPPPPVVLVRPGPHPTRTSTGLDVCLGYDEFVRAKAGATSGTAAPAVQAAIAAAGGIVTVVTDTWLQCDKCEKWRKVS